MYCDKCGKYNDVTNKFCEDCGNNLINTVVQTSNAVNNDYNIQSNNNVEQSNIDNVVSTQIFSKKEISVNNKSPKKKKGCLTAFIIFILIIVGLVFLFKFLTRDRMKNIGVQYTKDYTYLGLTDKGQYIISNAPVDIVFYVTSDTQYTVKDKDGNIVNTILENNKISNPSGYKKGEQYTITLITGSFTSEQLSDTKSVIFKIKRDEIKKYKYRENVIKLKNDSINVNNDSFKSSKKYNVGDVLVVENGSVVLNAYVVTNVSDNNYTVRDAKLDEIYSELDFYYESPVDLSNYEVSNQIKDYLVSSIENSAWYKGLFYERAYADTSIEIEIEQLENGIEANISVELKPGEENIFAALENHSITFEFTEQIVITQVVDITLTNWDVTFDITNSQTVEVKIVNEKTPFGSLTTKEADTDDFEKAMNALKDAKNGDEDDSEIKLASISIPLPVPCLNVSIDLKLVTEISFTVEFGYKVSQTINTVVGMDYGLSEDFKPIGSYKKDTSSASISFSGKLEAKFGLELSLGIELVNTVGVYANVSAGVYFETSLGIEKSLVDSSFTATAAAEAGLFLEFSLSAEIEIVDLEAKYKFVDAKWPIISKDWTIEYPEKNEEYVGNNNGNNANNDISYAEVKDLLESNSCVRQESGFLLKYKFYYNNGKFIGLDVIGAYIVNTGQAWLDSLGKFMALVMSVQEMIEHKVLVTVAEDDTYFYVRYHMGSKRASIELGNYGDINNIDYASFKAIMQSNGFTCK